MVGSEFDRQEAKWFLQRYPDQTVNEVDFGGRRILISCRRL